MQAIRRKMCFLVAATGIGFITSMLMLIRDGAVLTLHLEILLAFAVPATVFLAVLSIRKYKELKTAELIADNRILHVRPAVVGPDGSGRPSPSGSMEVFVSGFGMLLDSKVIKFNMNGIRLKGVEIGSEYLSLDYGTDRGTQKTRILHAAMDSREMRDMAEKFRFETGIVPVITD